MATSMREYLQSDMACEGLLECLHGLTELDRAVFGALGETGDQLTVDAVARRVGRERSTAYRSIQRLRGVGLVEREQVNYPQGGYYHVYRLVDPGSIADDMQRTLDEWYATLGQLIEEFRETYDTPERVTPA